MPSDPGSPHALHVPAHKRSQQTPSVQKPLSHSPSIVHAVPKGSAPTHTPALQVEHSSRSPRGAPLTTTHIPSVPGSPHALHVPRRARSQHTPSTQKPLSQVALSEHALPRVPAVEHTPTSQNEHSSRSPRGAPLTGTHIPSKPGSAQPLHAPRHARSQHTPSVHSPDSHSPSMEHTLPSVPAPAPSSHAPASQVVQPVRPPRGAPLIGVHIPSNPGSPHALQVPRHARSQQTPSTQ